jgi:tRNA(adenine34) deaminase
MNWGDEMIETFSEGDHQFMQLALKAAVETQALGNLPIGSVLVIDGKFEGSAANRLHTHQDFDSHAEKLLISKSSKAIRKASEGGKRIELFTTLEPCLMCLGTAVLNRISRVVYACPEPYGGSGHLRPELIRPWYPQVWPAIHGGLLASESFTLLKTYMVKNSQVWGDVLKVYGNPKSWSESPWSPFINR